jgi:hypothetical protein
VVNEAADPGRQGAHRLRHDCREGICGMCGCVVNGRPTAPKRAPPCASCTCAISTTATPSSSNPSGPGPSRWSRTWWWTAAPWTHIIQAGGYISANTGGAQDANAILVPQETPTRPWMPRLHRLRGLRGGLPQRVGHAVHRRQGEPPGTAAPGAARGGQTGPVHGALHGRAGISATAPTNGNARPSAPRRSPSPTSPGSTVEESVSNTWQTSRPTCWPSKKPGPTSMKISSTRSTGLRTPSREAPDSWG